MQWNVIHMSFCKSVTCKHSLDLKPFFKQLCPIFEKGE